MVERFYTIGALGVQPSRGRKVIKLQQVEEVATVVTDQTIDVRIISRALPMTCLPSTPDPNSCNFCLWGYLKRIVYQVHVSHIPTLKDQIIFHVRRINAEML
ncbi:hypothetical protein NPIL_340071 [Nephila pilipes]|uniref:Uncharacterized protein n=1 Tax=Nephila pilipes TaxID=299642 RepID=A0A8X6QHB2_NEPPI|nr:hypothetical protein NPIL_340071 [Nephila pilipes]